MLIDPLLEEDDLEGELLDEIVVLLELLILVEAELLVESLIPVEVEGSTDASCSVLMEGSNFVNSEDSVDFGSTKMDAKRRSHFLMPRKGG